MIAGLRRQSATAPAHRAEQRQRADPCETRETRRPGVRCPAVQQLQPLGSRVPVVEPASASEARVVAALPCSRRRRRPRWRRRQRRRSSRRSRRRRRRAGCRRRRRSRRRTGCSCTSAWRRTSRDRPPARVRDRARISRRACLVRGCSRRRSRCSRRSLQAGTLHGDEFLRKCRGHSTHCRRRGTSLMGVTAQAFAFHPAHVWGRCRLRRRSPCRRSRRRSSRSRRRRGTR